MSSSSGTGGWGRRRVLAGLGGLAAWPWPACGDTGGLRELRRLFGSPARLWLPGGAPGPVVDALWAGLVAIDRRWNAWKPEGLAQLNRALREGRAVPVVDARLAALIRRAAALEARSGGCFNPALGGLVRAWGFHADRLGDAPAPTQHQLERWLAAPPSLGHLRWQGDRLSSSHPGLQIDLGAIAKGWAADWALDRLQAAGVRDAVVDLGGNLAVMGQAVQGGERRPWRVGVRDPFAADDRDAWFASLAAQGREAVITSGTYERQRSAAGQVVHHLIDPARARPAHALLSATVVHRDAALADAAATALLVAGPARWSAVAQALGVDQALVVHPSGLAEATAALAPRLTPAPHWRGALRVV